MMGRFGVALVLSLGVRRVAGTSSSAQLPECVLWGVSGLLEAEGWLLEGRVRTGEVLSESKRVPQARRPRICTGDLVGIQVNDILEMSVEIVWKGGIESKQEQRRGGSGGDSEMNGLDDSDDQAHI